MNDIPRSDAQIIKELAAGARSLREDRAFRTAVAILERQWLGALKGSSDSTNILDIAAKMRALEEVIQSLDHLINDEKMLQAKKMNHA
jgi:hypothetical protein